MPRVSEALRQAVRGQRYQAQAKSKTVPAPVGGLNARDALANMPPTDAIILDNVFPRPTWVEPRGGSATAATFTGNCETLSAYNALSGTNQLYGAVNNTGTCAIYRMDGLSGGAVGTPVVGAGGNNNTAITSARWDYTQFGTGALESLVLTDGADTPLMFDGTTWWPLSSVTATITNITQAASAVVTVNTVSGSNPFTGVNQASFSGVVGMTQINGLTGTITARGGVSGAWTITVNINSSAFTAYGSGGTVNQFTLTGGPDVNNAGLWTVTRYKNRLWFIQKNTMNVYYLPQNVIAGALTQLNFGPSFVLGGFLQAIVTNSVDNAQGVNDYIAFISNQGEVVMFQGYDPANQSTWQETGHFNIGAPLAVGRRTWCKIGSDAVVLCADGAVPLSQALVTDRSQQTVAITDKIRDLVRNDVALYGTLFGWQILLYPEGTKIVANVPTLADTTAHQWVQNTLHGAWCTIGLYNTPWNAICFERAMGGLLYYGKSGSVQQCDITSSASALNDNGNAILMSAKPAFNYFDDPETLKIFTQVRMTFQSTGAVSASLVINTDFSQIPPSSNVPVSSGNNSPWGSLWQTPTYWGDASLVSQRWIGTTGSGYSGTLNMLISIKGVLAKWMATQYQYIPGGQFYGPG